MRGWLMDEYQQNHFPVGSLSLIHSFISAIRFLTMQCSAMRTHEEITRKTGQGLLQVKASSRLLCSNAPFIRMKAKELVVTCFENCDDERSFIIDPSVHPEREALFSWKSLEAASQSLSEDLLSIPSCCPRVPP
mmetsp:Transcript_10529/g.20444  ORF Transcript_10529/g.20444 Transcript_10529/m.20444 type:complete len:134 (-) Transcript_10529:84-485(-)